MCNQSNQSTQLEQSLYVIMIYSMLILIISVNQNFNRLMPDTIHTERFPLSFSLFYRVSRNYRDHEYIPACGPSFWNRTLVPTSSKETAAAAIYPRRRRFHETLDVAVAVADDDEGAKEKDETHDRSLLFFPFFSTGTYVYFALSRNTSYS